MPQGGIGEVAVIIQLVLIDLDVLEVDVIDAILELIQGLGIAGTDEIGVGGIVGKTQCGGGDTAEHLAPDGGGAGKVIAAGPLVGGVEHGAVLNGDADALGLGIGHDGAPHHFELVQILLHGLVLVLTDEGGDHVHVHESGGVNEAIDVGDGHVGSLLIGVHGVGIVAQRGDGHALILGVLLVIQELIVVAGVQVDMGDTGVAAHSLTHRPAADLCTLKAHLGTVVDDLLKSVIGENGRVKTEFHHGKFLL